MISALESRTSGAWTVPFLLNVAVNWVVPFLVLMPRASKRNRRVLKWTAVVMLAGRWLDLYVAIMPALYRNLKFDTVLLDMMLGDGTGLDLYRRVREMRPDLPVVVCTGFAENESLELIREDGHEVLLKPCTRHEVLRAVNRALLDWLASSS